MIPDLLGILLRARCAKNLLISDIAKAFLQIRLQEADRGVTKFFWLKDPSKPAAKNRRGVWKHSAWKLRIIGEE